ncbi:hypothetical protein BCV70DRAFT_201585 [Testicularia cyperi]|uniref:Uncharacterized protein n=1 Tax=Testicularia cyperi TaxID=1882483 RepID=A0A317XKE5_9BASI|nr:hypothetical protein BCV70DRAFT_201585 [Testicularia cyperi]
MKGVSSSKSSAAGPSATATTQQNNLHTLQHEHLARLASISLPKLAAQHSRRFMDMAKASAHSSDSLWDAQKSFSNRYRRALWAEDVNPTPALTEQHFNADKEKREPRHPALPAFYQLHNPRCSKCALPIIAGLNQRSSLKPSSSHQHSQSTRRKRTRTLKAVRCSLCRHQNTKT